MNPKARITYRFDPQETRRPASTRGAQEPTPIIPLTAEEYHVVEERVQAPDNPAPDVRDEEEPRWERVPFSSGLFDKRPHLNQFTTDFGSWSSPFDEETERVERAIRETGQATIQDEPDEFRLEDTRVMERVANPDRTERERTDREPVEREFAEREFAERELAEREWEGRGPDVWPEDPISRYDGSDRLSVRSGGTRFERHTRTPWVRIAAAVTGAITTGALLGFFVLHLFSGDDSKKTDPAASVTATAGTNGSSGGLAGSAATPGASGSPSAPAAGGGASTAPASASAATVSVRIPARNVTLLQVGAFGNQQGADQAAADLRKLGLAAATQAADKVYVYAGMTGTRDEALALSNKIKAQKTDVYLKALSVPGVTSIRWSGKQATAADTYFTQASKLATAVMNVTALHLKDAMPGPIEETTLQTIHTTHLAWSSTAPAMGEGLAEADRATLQKMNNALSMAVLSLDEYKKNPSASFLWQAQSGALQYVLLESELLSAIAAG